MLKQGEVVKLSSMSDLLKTASANVLQFKTNHPLPEALRLRARVTGRIVQMPAQDACDIEHYLAALREAGVAIEDMEIRRADLEDVFLNVMGEARATAGSEA
ncbi:hypothetical protein D3C78_1287380 [compost metagenome]